jgi:MFS family permease
VRADLAPLREREFRLLFAGRAVSLLGSAIAPVALAFAVLGLTGSKTDLGIILAARQVPLIVFILVGGIWADRLPRNHVMVAADLVSALSQATVATLLITGKAEIWHLVALAAVNGCSSAFFFPASQGVIPQTVPPQLLQAANALLRLGINGSLIGGAAVAGFLVAAFGSGTALAVDAATYFLGAVFIALMRLPASLKMEAQHFLRELGEGWREFRMRTWLWVIVIQFSLVNAVESGGLNVLGPAVAEDELGGARDFGLILTAQAIGLVVGGVVGLRYRPKHMLLVATGAILLMPIVLVVLGFPAPLPILLAAAFLAGIGIETFGILWDTTMQQEIPPAALSRVYSYDLLGSVAFVPIGLAVAGPVADLIGVREALWGGAAIVFLATLPVFAVRDVRNLQRRTLEP